MRQIALKAALLIVLPATLGAQTRTRDIGEVSDLSATIRVSVVKRQDARPAQVLLSVSDRSRELAVLLGTGRVEELLAATDSVSSLHLSVGPAERVSLPIYSFASDPTTALSMSRELGASGEQVTFTLRTASGTIGVSLP